jgi:cysteine desulfurase/selenocysteine lyase
MDIRNHFPILNARVHGKPLIYLDNAATTQKPQCVIDAVNRMHTSLNANIHRGLHYMAQECTSMYESARATIQRFIGARHAHEVVFTAGTTASINLAACCIGEAFVGEGDEIIVTQMEHHSNIVPWQMLCKRRHALLRVLPISDDGSLRMDLLPALLSDRTKLVCAAWVSNVLGTINPIEDIIRIAHNAGAPVLIDAAQGIAHCGIDVQALDVDYLAFSGHKAYAPTGIGVLYAKERWLEALPPYQGGGDMVSSVTFPHTEYAALPYKYEAGTANYVGAIALGAAVEFITSVGLAAIASTEQRLLEYAAKRLTCIEGIRIHGNAKRKSAIVSFSIPPASPADIGEMLDKMGIAVRTGTLCAQPTMQHYDVLGMTRVSMAFYNTCDEIDALLDGLAKTMQMLWRYYK